MIRTALMTPLLIAATITASDLPVLSVNLSGGMNASHFKAGGEAAYILEPVSKAEAKVGYQFGLDAEFYLAKYLSASLGVSYDHHTQKTPIDSVTWSDDPTTHSFFAEGNFDFLYIPLMIHGSLPLGNHRITLAGGVAPGLRSRAEIKWNIDDGAITSINPPLFRTDKYDLQFRIAGGYGYVREKNGIFITIAGAWGLRDLANPDPVTGIDGTLYSRAFIAGLTYKRYFFAKID